VSECLNICHGVCFRTSASTGDGKVVFFEGVRRGTASLYSASRAVIPYEVEIKAGEKLRARRRNKEHPNKKKREKRRRKKKKYGKKKKRR